MPLPQGIIPTQCRGCCCGTHRAPPALPARRVEQTSAASPRTAQGADFQTPHLSEHLSFQWLVLAMWVRTGWAGVAVQASIPPPPALPPKAHPRRAALLTLMLQKILREQAPDLLGTSPAALPASGWAPMVRASSGAAKSWAAGGLPSLSARCRRWQPARPAPGALRARECGSSLSAKFLCLLPAAMMKLFLLPLLLRAPREL